MIDVLLYGGRFDPIEKKKKIASLEEITKDVNFWNDKNRSTEVINELNDLKNSLESVSSLKDSISNNLEMLKELKNNSDSELEELLEQELLDLEIRMDKVEIDELLNGPYDKLSAIIEIHPGAGGTESMDWASMLFRMYTRWANDKGYKLEILDKEDGEEAGLKSVTFIVKGGNAYGYLKNEIGVHRLVRISPFDSNARRHTSFASVEVTPLFDNNKVNIEVKESDLKIDVYRSSGAGGQHVNTTDSAVRITHLPTKIVVTCQNERSQIQNREKALEILKNKLYQLELEKRDSEMKAIKGEQKEINFGSQIRSYVMCPYTLVKDHRTNTENVNVDKVLDGDIDMFINDNLKRGN